MNLLREASYAVILGLVISATPALMGAWFALRPSERLLSYMRPLSLAGLFAALCTISLGMTNGTIALSRQPGINIGMLLGGLSEVFAVAAISFAFLTIGWVCVAIGLRRHGPM